MNAESGRDAALVEVGRRIRTLRNARGLKQSDLAGEEMSVAYVSRIESGQRRPQPRLLALLAERLGTTSEHLLTGLDPDRAAEARLALRHAELAVRAGDMADGERRLRQALADVSLLPADDVAGAHLSLAAALEARGAYDDAIDVLERLVGEDGGWPVQAVIALCRCHRENGDFARAIDVGERGLRRLSEMGLRDDDDAVRLEVTVAGAYFVRGDLAHAARMCRDAAARAERSGSPTARASAYWNASSIVSERGRTHEAVELASRALALLGEGEDARSLARLRVEVGLLMLADPGSEPRDAAAILRRARRDLRSTSAPGVDEARCELGLARCALVTGDLDEAERHALAARPKVVDAPLARAQSEVVLGRIAAARGDMRVALERFRAAAALLTGVMADRSVADTWYEVGDLLDGFGDADGARDAYRSAAAAAGIRSSADAVRTSAEAFSG